MFKGYTILVPVVGVLVWMIVGIIPGISEMPVFDASVVWVFGAWMILARKDFADAWKTYYKGGRAEIENQIDSMFPVLYLVLGIVLLIYGSGIALGVF